MMIREFSRLLSACAWDGLIFARRHVLEDIVMV
jgi:hypothetical protein